MYILSSKKILLTLLAFSAVLYSTESFAMKRDDKDEIKSPSAKKKEKTDDQNPEQFVSQPLKDQNQQNWYLSKTLPYVSKFLTDKERGRVASVSKWCKFALYSRNPNPWPSSSFVVNLAKEDKGLFTCGYKIPVSDVTVRLDDYSRVEQIGAFFDWIGKNPPRHLAIRYTAPKDNYGQDEESQNLAAFGMALYMKRTQLKPVTSLSLHGFYNVKDSSGEEKDTLSVISTGISALFPHIEELEVDDCSFFDRSDWQDTGFADSLTEPKSITVSGHTSHSRDLEQYFKPTVEHVCLESLEIDRDFFQEDGFDWEESTHRVHTLFRDMPNLRSMTLRHITFVEVNTDNEVPCTEPELMAFLNFLMNLEHLDSLTIEGGNWVTDETREGMTTNFTHNLKKVRNLQLKW